MADKMICNSIESGNKVFYIKRGCRGDISIDTMYISLDDYHEIAKLVDFGYSQFYDGLVFYPDKESHSIGYLEIFGEYPYKAGDEIAILIMKFTEDDEFKAVVDVDEEQDMPFIKHFISAYMNGKSGKSV